MVGEIFNAIFGISGHKKTPPKIDPSHYGLDYEEINFYSRECRKRVLLQGWYLPSKNSNKCIIMLHGWRGDRAHLQIRLLEMAKGLVGRGYNILTFDLRAHGQSGGNKPSCGYYEAYDALGAYDFLVREKNILPQNIGLLGFSYGAMISILAARKENIRGVAVDSGPGDTFEFLKRYMKRFHIPLFCFGIPRLLTKAILRIDPEELSTKAAVEEISTPIFFIHGKKDDIPYTSVQELYRQKKKNPLDRIWITSARHTESYKDFPKQYLKRVTKFFNETLKPASE